MQLYERVRGEGMDSGVSKEYSARIDLLRKQYFSHRPVLCHERPLATTIAYRENEDDPVIIKKAKAFKKHCETKTVLIQDNELVVGNAGSRPRAGIFCPEIIWRWVEEELETINTRDWDPYTVSDETKEVLRDEVFPYWRGKSLEEWVIDTLPEETRHVTVDSPIIFLGEKLDSGPGQIGPDYEILLSQGLIGIKEHAEERIRTLDPEMERHSIDFLHAVMICCDGMIILSRRYAEEARRLADRESNETRKEELNRIAAVCERVPAYPARTFHEALQAVWFGQVGLNIEANAPSYSPGRFDQYIYPYYQKEVDAGKLTKEQAQELLECLWIKLSEVVWFSSEETAQYWAGYMPYQLLHVGGTDAQGNDATNELSYMCLEASIRVRLFQPSISILVDPKTPDDLLQKACELARLGDGHPSFFNNKVSIDMLLRKGVPAEAANECVVVGCSEVNSRHMYQWSSGPWYNIGAMVEFALSDGFSHVEKDYYGARTGNPRAFETYDQFYEAVKKQVKHYMHHNAIAGLILEIAHEKMLPLPFSSSIKSDCIQNAKDLTRGGARYNAGPGLTGVGIADTINSLAAVKKLVYEEKVLSMDDLLDAIESDFEGYEVIRQLLVKRAPKYGNDNEYVDSIAGTFTEDLVEEIERHTGKMGNKLHSAIVPTSANVPFGLGTWALPSGRKAFTPLADGISPNQGTDVKGPTSEVKSVARLKPWLHTIGTIFNMRFLPKSLQGKSGLTNMAALIRTYFEMGGFHVQFNVVSNETLRAAQEKPAEYQNLMVRVAGYSAYFVELAREVQNDIISRTEHALV